MKSQKTKTKRQKITKNTLIMELVERYPKAAEKLVTKYNFHCIGCSLAEMETLGEGAMAHGMCREEIKQMVEDLNKVASKESEGREKK